MTIRNENKKNFILTFRYFYEKVINYEIRVTTSLIYAIYARILDI